MISRRMTTRRKPSRDARVIPMMAPLLRPGPGAVGTMPFARAMGASVGARAGRSRGIEKAANAEFEVEVV